MKQLFSPTASDFRVIASLMPESSRTMIKQSDTRNERRLRTAALVVTDALSKARRNS